MKNYHLAVIGAGSGGLVAAEFAAKLGAKVALIEAQPRLGGECLHSGCVPSKALIHAARLAWQSTEAQQIGIGVREKPTVNFQAVMAHVNHSIDFIEERHDNDAYYQRLGIDVLHGPAEFISSDSLRVGETTLRAKRFIIATGSSPAVPPIKGLDETNYLTNESIFTLDNLPASLAVVGGGPIGCELGQAFAMLGSKVTVLQGAPRLLPRDEVEASEQVLSSFRDMGLQIHLDARVKSVKSTSSAPLVIDFDDAGDKTRQLQAEKLLIATGRRPNLPDGLELAGVNSNERGVKVDERLRTSAKHIYAIGDCNGGMQFTHAAAEQAVIATRNALFGSKKKFETEFIPWTTFTTPEVAHFGASKDQLKKTGQAYRRQRLEFNEIDKAVTESEAGFIEVLTGRKDQILGATVVGANAAELLGQLVLVREFGKPLKDLAGIVQAYPTYSLGLKQLSAEVVMDKISHGRSGKWLKQYLRFRFGS